MTPVIENNEETGEREIAYQASSPDEIALVKFTEHVGITLTNRTFQEMTITLRDGAQETYEILNNFPFTSAKKRMGIIVRNTHTGQITFLMKGADVIMMKIVRSSDWLEEECTNLAREGLRTLAFGRRILSQAEYDDFARRYVIRAAPTPTTARREPVSDRLSLVAARCSYHEAKTSTVDRDQRVQEVEISIEENLELLGLTGVEDKLQVRRGPSLVYARVSSRLISRHNDTPTKRSMCERRSRNCAMLESKYGCLRETRSRLQRALLEAPSWWRATSRSTRWWCRRPRRRATTCTSLRRFRTTRCS